MNYQDQNAALWLSSSLLVDILGVSDQREFDRLLCEQMRELTGANTALLYRVVADGELELGWTCPQRRVQQVQPARPTLLLEALRDADSMFEGPRQSTCAEARRWLRLANLESVFVQKLISRGELKALLCVADLPQPDRVDEVADLLETIAPVLAMALENLETRGALEVQQLRLEESVRERTEQLRGALNESKAVLYELDAANKALQRAKDQAESFLRIAAEIIISLDRRGNVILLNDSGHDLLGYPRGSLIGKNWFDVAIPEDAREGLRAVFNELMKGNLDAFERHEHKIITRDRDLLTIQWYNSLPRSPTGEVTGLLSSGQDVTAQKQQEADRRLLEDRLFQSQKLESIGRLAGGVAHDFNNLVQVILSATTMIRDESGIQGESRDLLEEIIGAGTRAAELTGQLLAFGRRQMLTLATHDLQEIVRSMGRMIQRVLPETIALDIETSEGPMWVDVDRGRIEQVLLNLCINARDAMISNGGRLTVATRRVERRVTAEPLQSDDSPAYARVAFEVRDDGCGMSQSTLAKIFEPFFTTKRIGEGTGLGLASANGIIEQHGGTIRAISEEGVGTTMTVLLPEVAGAASVESAKQVAPPEGRMEKVLLVDDNEQILRITARLLRRHGYLVERASNGREALALFREAAESVDLIISDMVMPEMGGLELMTIIRETAPDLPAILISGYDFEAELIPGDENLIMLQKPIRNAELLDRIDGLLHGDKAPD